MEKAEFDPKLKEMMDELEAVFKKYDTVGFVNATSRTHGEFKIFFPPWSTCQWERTPNGQMALRFKSKKGEHTHRDTQDTVFGIMSIKDMCAQGFQWMETLKKQLDKHMEIDHKTMPVIPHGQD